MNPRQCAKSALDHAMLSLIRAFNVANLPEVPYRFPPETGLKVKALIRDAVSLLEDSPIEPNDLGRETDQEFQRFIAAITGKES